jgi:hypothetical protein
VRKLVRGPLVSRCHVALAAVNGLVDNQVARTACRTRPSVALDAYQNRRGRLGSGGKAVISVLESNACYSLKSEIRNGSCPA